MAKKAVSVTLDEMNLLWLKGRARVSSGGNVSEELDKLITAARFGKAGAAPVVTSAVGMVDLSDDPDLEKADEAVREMWDEYLENVSLMAEDAPPYQATPRKKKRG